MLRQVDLPEVSGALYLSRMPGRSGPFDQESREIVDAKVDYVLSLAPMHQIEEKAPDYAQAVRDSTLDWARREFPIEDYQIPREDQWSEFAGLIRQVAADLESGRRLAIHCSLGKGRTGMVAVSVLLALGLDQKDALSRVKDAEGSPDTREQAEFIQHVAKTIRVTE